LNKQNQKIQQQAQQRKSKYNIYVFLVCLFVATFIWLLIKFSKDYDFQVKIAIEYVNIPNDKYITNADTLVTITLNVNGPYFLTKKILRKANLSVDLSEVSFTKKSRGNFITSIDIKKVIGDFVKNEYPYANRLTSVMPEALQLELEAAAVKKVPVIVPYVYTLEKQHYLYGSIKIIPDSIYVYGSTSKIEKINAITTDTVKAAKLSANFEVVAELKNSGLFGYHMSHKKVKLFIPVEKYTEAEYNLPVVLPSEFENKLRLFPETVKVFALVAIKDYKNITDDMFCIMANTDNIEHKTTLPLYLERFPPNVKINRITPDKVEFIKLK